MHDDMIAAVERDASAETAAALVALATEYLERARDRDQRVTSACTPAELAARFDEPVPRTGAPLGEVVRRLREDVIPHCNHLAHPRYVGHQVSASLPLGAWVEPLTAAINNSIAVFEMSPVGTILEMQVARWLCEFAGFGDRAGGTLTTGGTEATFTAMLAARSAVLPEAWTAGVGVPERCPLLVCGEHAHYAVTRAAGELGLGMNNVRLVPSRAGRMDPEALGRLLAQIERQGRTVMAVVATAGSTATGSFDDLDAITSVCAERDVWVHVDGAHGATALLSPRHRRRMHGIDRARSLAWDPHKMMLLPLQAGMLLMRDERDLRGAFAQRAPYLFHERPGEREGGWDQGVRSFLCSRRADVLKLWVALQRYGTDGFAALYDHFCDLTAVLHGLVLERKALERLHEPECNILCFRYVGRLAPEDERVDALNRELRERYNASGDGWITGTTLDGRRVLRMTVQNPRTTADDLRHVLDGIVDLGRQLEGGRGRVIRALS